MTFTDALLTVRAVVIAGILFYVITLAWKRRSSK